MSDLPRVSSGWHEQPQSFEGQPRSWSHPVLRETVWFYGPNATPPSIRGKWDRNGSYPRLFDTWEACEHHISLIHEVKALGHEYVTIDPTGVVPI